MPLITTDADEETRKAIEQSSLNPVQTTSEVAHYAFEASYDDLISE